MQVTAAHSTAEFRVLAWATECARSPSIEVGWLARQEILTKDGAFVDSFDYTVGARFDYPDQLEIKTRYIPTGHEMDASWSMMTNKDVRIDAEGNWTESMVAQGSTRDLGNKFRLRDLVRSHTVDAPILLGMWINEHPERVEILRESQSEGIVFRVSDLNWQAALAEAEEPARAWVRKLESIDSNGDLLSWYEYGEPVRIDGSTVRTGSVRMPVVVRGQPEPREGLSSTLEYARRVDPPASGVQAAGRGDGAKDLNEVTSRPNAGSTRIGWWIVGAFAMLAAGACVVLWLRRSP